MDGLMMFSSSYSLLKWLAVLLNAVLWCAFVIVIFKWIVNWTSGKAASKKIPTLKTRFGSMYGHIGTLPPTSVMKKTSLSLHSILLQTLSGHAKLHEKESLFEIKIGYKPFVILTKHQSVEDLLSSNAVLEKSSVYVMLHPWLGTGLLTSHGSKWKSRRKLLTPSFHFDILKDFVPAFDDQSKVLVSILKKRADEWIDIVGPITLCSLDIICETTLGTHIGAQTDSESEYVQAVLRASKTVMERFARPMLHADIIFSLSALGRQFRKDIDCLHNFTRKVIREKKEALKYKNEGDQSKNSEDFHVGSKRRRKALMDLLLDVHMKFQEFSEEDVREEIDTFAFEGHDTTSMGMSWALYLIGWHPDVQTRIHDELDQICGDDPDRPITPEDLREMQYLERVLKESQRLFPSVPVFGRLTSGDFYVCGYKIKKGSEVSVFPYVLHRDPEVFPNPEVFDPDRFLPENTVGRNPFAYIPFSAGPRNCIGQRFAFMEEKVVIANVLRCFHVKSLEQRDMIHPGLELILRPVKPLKMKFTPRNSSL